MPVECDVFPIGRRLQCVITSTAKNSLNGKRIQRKVNKKQKRNLCLHALRLIRPSLMTTKEYSSLYEWYTCASYVITMS